MARAQTNPPQSESSGAQAPAASRILVHAVIKNDSGLNDKGPGAEHTRVTLFVEALKALAWPLLALAFFLTFQDAIRRTIALVPDKLEKADKANIGSLSWEIQQRAREEGGSDLARRLGILSPGAIERLIATPRNGIHGVGGSYRGPNNEVGFMVPSKDDVSSLQELESAQLVKFTEPLKTWLPFVRSLSERDFITMQLSDGSTAVLSEHLTPAERERFDKQVYQLTPKGRQAVEAIVKAIGEQLRS
jgi:hypothetical protein